MEPSIRLNLTFTSLPLHQCQNCWRFGHPAEYCRSTARCSLCASPGHTHTNCPSTIHVCANSTQEHNVFRGCSIYKFESEVAALCFKHGFTLKEASLKVRLCGFQQVPLSQRISINTPQTTTNTDSPPTTSYPPSSTHTASSPTPLVPSSSTITSSTSLTHLVVTSVPVNNIFSLLNLDTQPLLLQLQTLPHCTSVPNTKPRSCAYPPKTFY